MKVRQNLMKKKIISLFLVLAVMVLVAPSGYFTGTEVFAAASVKSVSIKSKPSKVKYNVDMDKLGQCDYNRNNGFLIEINSQLFNPDPWLVRNFSSNSGTSNELFIEIAEPNTLCIQALLDLSMKNDVRYTIRKKILSARLDVLYTVIYNECKVCNYVESALDYRNDGIRTYKISFNYNEHEYEY